jgi:hypothetical protein
MHMRLQRFILRMDVGEHAVDYDEVAKQEHLSGTSRVAINLVVI